MKALVPVVLLQGGDGMHVAACPLLDGCITQGPTAAEALQAAAEAIEATLDPPSEEAEALAVQPGATVEYVAVDVCAGGGDSLAVPPVMRGLRRGMPHEPIEAARHAWASVRIAREAVEAALPAAQPETPARVALGEARAALEAAAAALIRAGGLLRAAAGNVSAGETPAA